MEHSPLATSRSITTTGERRDQLGQGGELRVRVGPFWWWTARV
ncbi:MAG TPA: hypothetical protein VGG68_00580 [Caulobacteraceae bacterium]